MARRAGASAMVDRPRRSRVLVFGEDDHDRKAIKALAEGLRPDLAGRVELRRSPLFLVKNQDLDKTATQAEKIAEIVRTEQPVCAVLAHEDCDDLEPAHERVAAAKRAALAKALAATGCVPIPVTPAWEIEAWWFLWPQAVKAANPSWRAPDDHVGKHVGSIRDAKEELKRCVRPRGKSPRKVRDYEEADSPAIARHVVAAGIDSYRAKRTRSDSFEAFRNALNAIPRG